MKKLGYSAAIGALFLATAVQADEGLYYGVALGYSDMSSTSLNGGGATSGQDFSVGGIVGYGFALQNGANIAVEGTLDVTTGNTFSDDINVGDACTNNSPDWCEVDAIARVRGVYGTTMANGYEVLSMAGIAAVSGRAEDGPANFADTTAVGYTLGVGLETDFRNSSIRYELTYDNFDEHSPEAFDKDLEIISLRVAFMF